MGVSGLVHPVSAWVAAIAVSALLAFDPLPAKAAEAVSAEDLEDLVAAMEDEDRRHALITQIQALIAAKRQTEAEDVPGRLSSGLLAVLSENVRETGRMLAALADALGDLPVLSDWLRSQVVSREVRRQWLQLLAKLAAIVAIAWLAERAGARLLNRPRRALEHRQSEALVVKGTFLIARTVLDLAPIAAFAGAAYGAITLVQPGPRAHLVALAFVNAYLVARVVVAVARMTLVPAARSLRVVPVSDETANYVFIWCRRFTAVAVFGNFAAQLALLLGLPRGGHLVLLQLTGLVLAAMAVVFILQNREVVHRWVRGSTVAGPQQRTFRQLRNRLADIWHALAILYVTGIYVVWAFGVEGGFAFMLRATLASVVILVVARLASVAVEHTLRRGFALSDEVKARFPTVEVRANRYLPVLDLTLRSLVWLIAALGLLQAWGIDAIGTLDTPTGRRVVGAALTIGVVLVLAFAILEGVSSAIERFLHTSDEHGEVVERSARVRTLLPLLHNVILVFLSVIVTLIVLSELGINIAPLLAGAGVVGLAVGFGSQKLVQDVITGVFILFEDTIAVGDVVTAGGHTGVVETLSIRSIRLRDLAGNVYTVPFSTVGTVTNMTKDFSFAVFNVGVAYGEDTDRVSEVLIEIGEALRADPEYGPDILEPLEVLGVDAFQDSAVVIKARLKTLPIKQWRVRREFNRRLKQRFDELGIVIPFPHRTLYFAEKKEGRAAESLGRASVPEAAGSGAADDAVD